MNHHIGRALLALFIVLGISKAGSADTIEFINGAVLQGKMLGSNETHIQFESDGFVGNYSRNDVLAVSIGDLEPKDLDKPTSWQEGDPAPQQTNVPAQEPEQQSEEAPPAQPMEDDPGEPPGPRHIWVTGYWWWHWGHYMWVPGYWAVPPYVGYVYIPGYWSFVGGMWIYVRGGWGYPGGAILLYPYPRPVLWVSVYRCPRRIVRRHPRWHHHHHRHVHHEVYVNKKNPKAAAGAAAARHRGEMKGGERPAKSAVQTRSRAKPNRAIKGRMRTAPNSPRRSYTRGAPAKTRRPVSPGRVTTPKRPAPGKVKPRGNSGSFSRPSKSRVKAPASRSHRSPAPRRSSQGGSRPSRSRRK